ncbi:MAG: AsmA family protein, partial [Desulfobacterales bacterium]|nr:AsmA family protein [Desulfobacterales bacterium]
MRKLKKISLWVMGITGALLVLFLLFAPRVINLEPIRGRVVSALSKEVGGEVTFERVRLSFFPRPSVEIQKARLSVPGKIQGTLTSVTVYPRILPLLKGQIQISKVRVAEPQFRIPLPAGAEGKEESPAAGTLPDIQRLMAPLLAPAAIGAPDLRFEMKKGRLDLYRDDRTVFSFSDIHGSAGRSPKGFDIEIACESNLSKSIAVKSTLDLKEPAADGQIDLSGFHPGVLTDYLFPRAFQRLSESEANLSFTFNFQGLTLWKAEVEG